MLWPKLNFLIYIHTINVRQTGAHVGLLDFGGVFNVSKNWYPANQSGSWNQNGKKENLWVNLPTN
jgi:hypothetical protein